MCNSVTHAHTWPFWSSLDPVFCWYVVRHLKTNMGTLLGTGALADWGWHQELEWRERRQHTFYANSMAAPSCTCWSCIHVIRCVSVYIYIYIHTYTYTYMTYMYIYLYIYIYIYIVTKAASLHLCLISSLCGFYVTTRGFGDIFQNMTRTKGGQLEHKV